MNKWDFEKFYRKNIDRIYRYVFFRVNRNHAQTEDIVSEIFLKALRNFESYDPAISQSAWIYRIAQNHLANVYRDQKTTESLDQIDVPVLEDFSVSIELEDQLRNLSAEDRQIVTMRHLLGYPYKEIGSILGKTVGAVKMASHRALKTLIHKNKEQSYVRDLATIQSIKTRSNADSND